LGWNRAAWLGVKREVPGARCQVIGAQAGSPFYYLNYPIEAEIHEKPTPGDYVYEKTVGWGRIERVAMGEEKNQVFENREVSLM